MAIAWFVVPPLVNQLASFAEHVPGYVDRFQGLRRDYAKIRARYPELGPFDQEVAKLADPVHVPAPLHPPPLQPANVDPAAGGPAGCGGA